jgi:type III secretion protein Q
MTIGAVERVWSATTHRSGGRSVEPLRRRPMARYDLRLAACWYRRWRPVEIELAGAMLRVGPARDADRMPDELRLLVSMTEEGHAAGLVVPLALVDLILQALGATTHEALAERSMLLLLEHAAAASLESLERRLGSPVALSGARILTSTEPIGLPFDCEFGDRRFVLALAAPGHCADLLASLARRPDPVAQADLSVAAVFRVGTTRLPVGLLKRLAPGDVITFDCTALSNGFVAAVIGECRLGFVRLQGAQATLMTQPLRITGDIHAEWTSADMTMTDDDDDAGSGDTELDEVQVKLLFEMGRVEISLGELRTLAPGYIFDLGRDPARAVEIRAGGRRIGHGEVVQIGDALGVRIMRLFNNE